MDNTISLGGNYSGGSEQIIQLIASISLENVNELKKKLDAVVNIFEKNINRIIQNSFKNIDNIVNNINKIGNNLSSINISSSKTSDVVNVNNEIINFFDKLLNDSWGGGNKKALNVVLVDIENKALSNFQSNEEIKNIGKKGIVDKIKDLFIKNQEQQLVSNEISKKTGWINKIGEGFIKGFKFIGLKEGTINFLVNTFSSIKAIFIKTFQLLSKALGFWIVMYWVIQKIKEGIEMGIELQRKSSTYMTVGFTEDLVTAFSRSAFSKQAWGMSNYKEIIDIIMSNLDFLNELYLNLKKVYDTTFVFSDIVKELSIRINLANKVFGITSEQILSISSLIHRTTFLAKNNINELSSIMIKDIENIVMALGQFSSASRQLVVDTFKGLATYYGLTSEGTSKSFTENLKTLSRFVTATFGPEGGAKYLKSLYDIMNNPSSPFYNKVKSLFDSLAKSNKLSTNSMADLLADSLTDMINSMPSIINAADRGPYLLEQMKKNPIFAGLDDETLIKLADMYKRGITSREEIRNELIKMEQEKTRETLFDLADKQIDPLTRIINLLEDVIRFLGVELSRYIFKILSILNRWFSWSRDKDNFDKNQEQKKAEAIKQIVEAQNKSRQDVKQKFLNQLLEDIQSRKQDYSEVISSLGMNIDEINQSNIETVYKRLEQKAIERQKEYEDQIRNIDKELQVAIESKDTQKINELQKKLEEAREKLNKDEFIVYYRKISERLRQKLEANRLEEERIAREIMATHGFEENQQENILNLLPLYQKKEEFAQQFKQSSYERITALLLSKPEFIKHFKEHYKLNDQQFYELIKDRENFVQKAKPLLSYFRLKSPSRGSVISNEERVIYDLLNTDFNRVFDTTNVAELQKRLQQTVNKLEDVWAVYGTGNEEIAKQYAQGKIDYSKPLVVPIPGVSPWMTETFTLTKPDIQSLMTSNVNVVNNNFEQVNNKIDELKGQIDKLIEHAKRNSQHSLEIANNTAHPRVN